LLWLLLFAVFSQELWAMLHSASSNESGVPQQLLDAKQQELRERREREAAIQVRLMRSVTHNTHQGMCAQLHFATCAGCIASGVSQHAID
jgi:hypothetical protein